LGTRTKFVLWICVFGPAIIDRLAQYLKAELSSEDEETESVAGLFEEGHNEYYLVYFFTMYEGSGKIVEDRQSEAKRLF
jgi:hypothetical protein